MDERIKVVATQILSRAWGTLTLATLDYRHANGTWQRQSREIYDHGNAVAIILFDPARRTVLLTRQYRHPVSLNGDPAWLIEACAGLLDEDDKLSGVMREALEETGHRPRDVQWLFDAYMSPGSLTERLSLFVGHYDAGTRIAPGGGLAAEGEEIEVLEMRLDDALAGIGSGAIIDAKTIMLLHWLALNR
ncbi:NUDIX domain-containing protein [uncultured Devosia sp.]|uniref:NUDIX domain-containing protein n=1 Tax=uncultured Devosia sp. TaxID=211434 RepID=UPI0035CAB03D